MSTFGLGQLLPPEQGGIQLSPEQPGLIAEALPPEGRFSVQVPLPGALL